MATLDEQIAQHIRDVEASGELRAAPSYGKPLALDDGFDETPLELRMPFKLLKDAGVVPYEVTMLRELARLREDLARTTDPDQAAQLRRAASDLQQHVALRLERLRVTGAL